MSIEFQHTISLLPIPTDSRRAARQARVFEQRLVAVGDLDALKAEALDAIIQTSNSDDPGELKRMRLLFKDVYTEAELQEYISASFVAFGFTD